MVCDAIDCGGFVNVCSLFVLSRWMRTDHTPDPSALILGVKFCDQETGTNLHTQERTKDLNAPAAHRHFSFLSCSGWRHLSCSCAYTFLVDVRRSKRTDTKNMA